MTLAFVSIFRDDNVACEGFAHVGRETRRLAVGQTQACQTHADFCKSSTIARAADDLVGRGRCPAHLHDSRFDDKRVVELGGGHILDRDRLDRKRNTVAAGQMRASLQARIERVMAVTLSREMDRLEKQMTFLASVGSTAPFIGLFGTVWGIMRSFHAIGVTKNTSIASVAPGLAEALFATALGLIAAIPAVIAYNKISTELNRYAGRLDTFSSEFGAILSRQLEEKS